MKIGYAMYSAYPITQDAASLRKTLEALGRMGYDGAEMLLYSGTPAGDLKRILADNGLEAIATHVHKPRWAGDGAKNEIDYAAEAGIPALVYPWIDAEDRTPAFYKAFPERLNELAALCGERGLKLLYHNHDFEFRPYEDTNLMTRLLEASDRYGYEMDTFWADFAGVDPVAYMKKLGSRVPMIHIKDYLSAEGADTAAMKMPQFCPIGMGKMDNASIVHAARELGTEWVIVELDNTPLDILESARISLEAVRAMVG